MGIGPRGQKDLTKMVEMRKWVDAIALFQLHDEDSWLFSSPCNATSPVLQFCELESYKESQQKVREGDKISTFSLSLVSRLS